MKRCPRCLLNGSSAPDSCRLRHRLFSTLNVLAQPHDHPHRHRFAALKREGRAALVTFLMAGDPDSETSLAILKALPEAGADVIELGMPFTDPMADGPAIQAGGLRALKAGQTMTKTLALVRAFREGDDATPIVLMGYYNPIYIYGVDRFLADAKAAGVDGLIVVDLPPEEDEELCLPALQGRAQLHPPGDADHRRQAAAGRAREHLGLRLLRLDHRHHRHGGARRRQGRRGGRAHQAPHQAAGRGRLRRADRRAGARHRAKAPTASWSARRWSTRCEASLDQDGKATARTVERRHRPGARTRRRRARRATGKPSAAPMTTARHSLSGLTEEPNDIWRRSSPDYAGVRRSRLQERA